jgi:hypothetical protein
MNNQWTIIIWIIVIILIIIVWYFVMKFLKGKLKLNLNKTSFQSSEKITWILDLEVKKNISGHRLFVALVEREKTKTTNSQGKKTTRTQEIRRFEIDLEHEKEFSAWFKKAYQFEIPFPSNQEKENNWIANSVIQWIGLLTWNNSRKTIQWYLEARLDAKGIDLTDSKRIYLNFNKN